MKYRYIKISGSYVFGTNEITKSDLIGLRDGRWDVIIDTHNYTKFNPDQNDWVEILGSL